MYSTKTGGTCVLGGVTSETAILRLKPIFFFPNRKLIGAMIGGQLLKSFFHFFRVINSKLFKIHLGTKIFDEIPRLVDRYLAGELPVDDFITGTYKLEQINEAFDFMATGNR